MVPGDLLSGVVGVFSLILREWGELLRMFRWVWGFLCTEW